MIAPPAMLRALLAVLLLPLAEARPPNIVLIMADDLGIEGLGCYGGESYRTPHLDELARGGLRFTQAYSQPLCTPTRVQIMTGQYNHRNWLAFGLLPRGQKTFGHLMSSFDYKTCIAGKWQLTSYDPPDYPGAADRRGRGMPPQDAGFDEYALFHAAETEDKGSRYADPTYLQNGELRTVRGAYGEDLWVEFLLSFMERHREAPMFLYYPMALPHWPMVPAPNSKDWADPTLRLNESTQYFPDMVEYMDRLVGRLVAGIDRLGLRDDTIVIFYSDNGTDRKITSRFRGSEIVGGKNQVRQAGIRVPLIANWPGTIKPGVIRDLVDASDFLPTLAELAGKQVPQDWFTDGVSFAPRLFGKPGTPREWSFFWYDPRPGWDKESFSRHVFALDHHYKCFADGRFYHLPGDGLAEVDLSKVDELEPAARAAREKLKKVIAEVMTNGPVSEAARVEVDAFGKPVK